MYWRSSALPVRYELCYYLDKFRASGHQFTSSLKQARVGLCFLAVRNITSCSGAKMDGSLRLSLSTASSLRPRCPTAVVCTAAGLCAQVAETYSTILTSFRGRETLYVAK
jgi:hypothetical protein